MEKKLIVLSLFLSLFVLLFSLWPQKAFSYKDLESQAKDYYYQGDLEKARDLYITLLDEESPYLYYDLAIIHRELHEHEEAIDLLRYLAHLYPEEPLWLRELGIFYYTIGHSSQAIEHLRESLSLASNREAYYYLGLSLREGGDYNGSHRSLQEALAIDPTFALAYYQLALLYDYLEMIEEAIEYYLLSLRYDSSMTEIHTLLGERYLELGDFHLAYQRFQRAVIVNPNSLNKARLQEMEDRFPNFAKKDDKEEQRNDLGEIQWIRSKPAPFQEGAPIVRVMLLEEVEALNIMMSGPFLIRDGQGGEVLGQGEGETIWEVRRAPHGYIFAQENKEIPFLSSIYLEMKDERVSFLLFHVLYGHGQFWAGVENRQYRGDLELLIKERGIMAINHLHVEEYLYSVVPSEMPSSWPMEALKAQAVAARSYTLRRLGEGEYDLCSTVLSAVYRGLIAEHPRSREAVDATKGEVLLHNGTIIDAVYSSNAGGHTESSASIWGGERAYLQPVSTDHSPKEPPLSPGELRAWLKEGPPSYSYYPPYSAPNLYRWVRSFQAKKLEEIYSIGRIYDITILSRGEGGSVLSLALKGEEGEVILKGSSIRPAFQNLRSSRFFVERIYDDLGHLKELLFYGGGFGHGVGMGQTEAAAMANEGRSYLEILSFFYQDTQREMLY